MADIVRVHAIDKKAAFFFLIAFFFPACGHVTLLLFRDVTDDLCWQLKILHIIEFKTN